MVTERQVEVKREKIGKDKSVTFAEEDTALYIYIRDDGGADERLHHLTGRNNTAGVLYVCRKSDYNPSVQIRSSRSMHS